MPSLKGELEPDGATWWLIGRISHAEALLPANPDAPQEQEITIIFLFLFNLHQFRGKGTAR